ncbi:hypothetical protein [Maridesulfovibrio sp.]|uniref:hypothetical protein n=1 Tax=Maridesulfovibrio sp. TaxID=2795000 RepID=UPI002A18D41C|nr:hypothetical protein [Maridesulfovibrio sp.]
MKTTRILSITILLGLCASMAFAEQIPGKNVLQRMSEGLVVQLKDDLIAKNIRLPLKGVLVGGFLPQGADSSEHLSEAQQAQSQTVHDEVEKVFSDTRIFMVRDSDWRRFEEVIMDDTENISVDEEDKIDLGGALKAQWIVQGDYFWEEGKFYIDIKLLKADTKQLVGRARIDNSYVRLYKNEIAGGGAGVVLLLGGIVYLMLRSRKCRYLTQAETEAAVREAILRRDPFALRELLDNSPAPVSGELREQAGELFVAIKGLTLEGASAGRVVIVPGPVQGLGRVDSAGTWNFSFRDPHISRGPHAWFKFDSGRYFAVANGEAHLAVNDEDVSSKCLENGDVVMLPNSNHLEFVSGENGDAARLTGVEGVENGAVFIMVDVSVSLGGENQLIAIPGLERMVGAISFDEGLAFLTQDDSGEIGIAGAEPGNKAVLKDNDVLVIGNARLTVKTIAERK